MFRNWRLGPTVSGWIFAGPRMTRSAPQGRLSCCFRFMPAILGGRLRQKALGAAPHRSPCQALRVCPSGSVRRRAAMPAVPSVAASLDDVVVCLPDTMAERVVILLAGTSSAYRWKYIRRRANHAFRIQAARWQARKRSLCAGRRADAVRAVACLRYIGGKTLRPYLFSLDRRAEGRRIACRHSIATV